MRQKAVAIAAALTLAAVYVAAGLINIHAHVDAAEMDTTAYLAAAYDVRQTGGITHHLQNLWNGTYREATQHPLYLLLLSTLAERNLNFFVNAKILTFAVGGALFLVFWLVSRSLFGTAAALAGLCLLVFNASFFHLSTMVACESLFAVFFLLFWFFAARGFEHKKYWLVSGLFAGLAFLTKSLAIFSLPIFIFSVLTVSHPRRQALASRFFWGFFAVFFLVASPLLIRNVRVFGTPFFSNSSAVLWLDRWHDYDRPDIQKHPPTLGSYLATHRPSQIAQTFLEGLFLRDPKMISDGLKPFPFWDKRVPVEKLRGFHQRTAWWQDIFAGVLFLLCLAEVWRRRQHPAAVIAGVSLLIFLVFVAWYSKVFPGDPPTRLLYPVLFFVLIYAGKALSDIFFRGLCLVSTQVRAALGTRLLCLLFGLVYLASLGAHFDWQKLNLRKSYAFNAALLGQLKWISQNAAEGRRVMAGTMLNSYLFYFEPSLKVKVFMWPKVNDLEELKTYIHENSLDYGVLDMATVAYDLELYGAYFNVSPVSGLQPLGPLPQPFHRVFRDLSRMPLYEIYDFKTAS